jgi:hypothetical protein
MFGSDFEAWKRSGTTRAPAVAEVPTARPAGAHSWQATGDLETHSAVNPARNGIQRGPFACHTKRRQR